MTVSLHSGMQVGMLTQASPRHTGSLYFDVIDSPAGLLTIVASEEGLRALVWKGDVNLIEGREGALRKPSNAIIHATRRQLEEYFSGKRREFDLPLDVQGSVFQKRAWKELSKIPYGETISYQEQARRLGDAKKARAVGLANGKNPVGIIVPCHRVIGKNGKLTGFAAGLGAKQYLLDLEKATEKNAV